MYADIETLYRTTIRTNPDCAMAYDNLGLVLAGGRAKDAIPYYQKALNIAPDYVKAHNNLGLATGKRRTIGRGRGAFPEERGDQPQLSPGPQQPG